MLAAALLYGAIPVQAAERLVPLDVALGDVSLSFLVAADAGIYQRNAMDRLYR
jgi:hypothetical protein